MTDVDALTAAMAMARLRALRTALLPLHRALIDSERAQYERVHGRIDHAQRALRLVLDDPWFAWLRPLASLIVAIDGRLAEEAPVQPAEVAGFEDSIRALLQRDPHEAFREPYHRALQRSPEVVVAHGAVSALLADK
jgi:hypothetical protein